MSLDKIHRRLMEFRVITANEDWLLTPSRPICEEVWKITWRIVQEAVLDRKLPEPWVTPKAGGIVEIEWTLQDNPLVSFIISIDQNKHTYDYGIFGRVPLCDVQILKSSEIEPILDRLADEYALLQKPRKKPARSGRIIKRI